MVGKLTFEEIFDICHGWAGFARDDGLKEDEGEEEERRREPWPPFRMIITERPIHPRLLF